MTTAQPEQSFQHQQDAAEHLRSARCRQLAANAATPTERPGGRPVMLTEEQLLADDAVEIAELRLCAATLATVRWDSARSARGPVV